MNFHAELKIAKEIEALNIPESQIWQAYENHKFWCQCHSEYPMDRNSFFGDYEFRALACFKEGKNVLDPKILDHLHGYNGEIDYEYMSKKGYKV